MASSAYNRGTVVSSISSLYKLLTKLPYVDPEALVYPPNDENNNGWTGINETELRRRGKSDGIMDLLRHLPYLKQPKNINQSDESTAESQRWMISPNTVTIAYCDGDVYDEKMDQIQPTPGHCIWLTDLAEGDCGTALLLDSNTGTITEYSKLGQNIVLSPSVYQELPLEDRWMAHTTIDAVEFFHILEKKFETLELMTVYDQKGKAGTALWYCDMHTDSFEDLTESDDESFVPDSEEDSSSDDDEYEWDSDYESETELEFSDEDSSEYQTWNDESQCLKSTTQPDTSNSSEEPKDMKMREQTRNIHGIHMLNGWPSSFNREMCRKELADYVGRTEQPAQEKKSEGV